MLTEAEVEQAITRIAAMGAPALQDALRQYRADFPLDLTDEFLAEQDPDRLKHLLAAVCLHCGHVPESPAHPAARAAA